MNFFIVEELPGFAELTIAALQQAGVGFTWATAVTGQETQCQLNAANDLGLICCDQSPLDGCRFWLSSQNQSELQVPFIVVSSQTDLETAVACMKLGASDYIPSSRLERLPQVEEKMNSQVHRLAALRDIDMAITASLDLRITLQIILDKVSSQLDIDAVALFLLNEHTQLLEYAAGRGFRKPLQKQMRLNLGDSLAGRTARERSVLIIPDLSQAPSLFSQNPMMAGEGFVTYYGVPLITKGMVKGILEIYQRSPLPSDPDWLGFLEALANQAAIAIDNARLFEDLQRSNAELILAYDNSLEGWSHALDMRDQETEGHSRRVTDMTMTLAQAMGMVGDELVHVYRGALLHDIGKMGIPDSILLKPGPLTPEEWVIMRQHPENAYKLLSPISHLRRALEIPYGHHEKWDGSGYPRGLKGEEIPLSARIFAVVDAWDALNSDRPYRKAWAKKEAFDYIRNQSGKSFDPAVVETFSRLFPLD